MRLSVEQIKAAIQHPEAEVREAALFYFAGSHSDDPSIMPLVIQAVERFGLDAFANLPAADLVQTDDTIAWLIGEIERIDRSTGEREVQYVTALREALCRADAALLKRYASTIESMQQLDAASQQIIADRISVVALAPDVLWRELIDFCDRENDADELSDRQCARIDAVVDALSGFPEQCAERVLANLAVEDAANEWLEGFMIRLAGQIRLAPAIPHLVEQFNLCGEWLCEEAEEALQRIGTDEAVAEIAERYLESGGAFRLAAATTLEHVHADSTAPTCLELLQRESDAELQRFLLQSALMNFATEAIEPARQFVLRSPKSPDMLEVRSDLLVACKLLGETFPEYAAWLEDAKTDTEFRRQFYEDIPLVQFADDFDRLGDDEDDEIDVDLDDFEEDEEETLTVVRRHAPIGRNDPCPCGSGKKFKKCCYGKAGFEESDEVHAATMSDVPRSQTAAKFPVGTVAFYGPNDQSTTKIVAGVIRREGAEPILQRWVGTNVVHNPKIKRQMQEFFRQYKVKNVVASEGNMGCPHEEGQDFPHGEDCPFCPYWSGKQGSNQRY